jgi:hypothetical protein
MSDLKRSAKIKMSKGWSPSDKIVAQKAATKAKSTAESEAIRLHKETKILRIEDLWALELKIREWRRDRQHVFTINYESVEGDLVGWINKG